MAQARARLAKVNDREIEVYSITLLSEYIGKSTQTIRRWERKKFIFPPILDFGIEHGRLHKFRWYTADEVKAFVTMVAQYQPKRGEWQNVSAFFPRVREEVEQIRGKISRKEPITERLDFNELKAILSMFGMTGTRFHKKKKKRGKIKSKGLKETLEEINKLEGAE